MNQPKIISMYLPQYHQVHENDIWWGEGYTEWTAVKAAKKYYASQTQPKIPLNHNYYDLTDKDTMLWQSTLMKEYGIYGQCFYHYYFKDGKIILNTPAENLLKWNDIEMPFCFCWANESWIRSWSALEKGVNWNSKKERFANGENVLLQQQYGGKSEWKEHIEYLIPFFNDNRYIKKNNRPVFLIYKPNSIYCIDEMCEYWNSIVNQHGIENIYYIGVNCDFEYAEEVLQLEGNYSGLSMNRIVNYMDISTRIISNAYIAKPGTIYCATPGYDDTPRRGKMGSIFLNSTPDMFYKQFKTLLYLSEKRENDYLFINAWNEWGEGMYLEPDEENGYGYLNAIKKAISEKNIEDDCIEKLLDKDVILDETKDIVFRYNARNKRLVKNNDILRKLLVLKYEGKGIENVLHDQGVKRIAIYGLGDIGNLLVNILEKTDIEVEYGIDKNRENKKFDFAVYSVDEILPPVDMVIITCDGYEYEKLKCNNLKYMTINELLEAVCK